MTLHTQENSSDSKNKIPTLKGQTSLPGSLASSTDSIVTETNKITRAVDHKTGKKRINQYVLVREIGRGYHGKVKLGYDVETNTYWVYTISLNHWIS